MSITKMHTKVKFEDRVTTLNHLESEGILELYERKVFDPRRGDLITKFYAKIPNSEALWEITPQAYKARVE